MDNPHIVIVDTREHIETVLLLEDEFERPAVFQSEKAALEAIDGHLLEAYPFWLFNLATGESTYNVVRRSDQLI